jgi:hypothetical protein
MRRRTKRRGDHDEDTIRKGGKSRQECTVAPHRVTESHDAKQETSSHIDGMTCWWPGRVQNDKKTDQK